MTCAREVVLNSQVRHRTVKARGAQSDTEGGMPFHQSRLRPRVAALHGDGEPPQTATMDVIDPPQGPQQKTQPIREPSQFRLRS